MLQNIDTVVFKNRKKSNFFRFQNLFRNAGLRRNQLSNNFNNTDWTRFVPTTPSTDEIDCHVEIEVVSIL